MTATGPSTSRIANRRSVTAAPTADGDRAFVVDDAGMGTIHELPSGAVVGRPIDVGLDAEVGIISHEGRHVVVQTPRGLVVFDAATGVSLARFDHGREQSELLSVVGDLAGIVGTTANGLGESDVSLIVDVSTMQRVLLGPGILTGLTADGTSAFMTLDGLEVELVDHDTSDVAWQLSDAATVNFVPSGEYIASFFEAVSFHTYPGGEPIGPSVPGDGEMPWADGVLTQQRDGRYHVWNTDVESWPDVACQAAGRNLTRAEWEAHMPPDTPYEPSCPQWPVEA